MIHVIFDTSGIGLNKYVMEANYLALKRLVEKGEIKIHIPYIVKREIETQEEKFYSEKHKDLKKAIKSFNKLVKSEELNHLTKLIVDQFNELNEKISDDYFRFSQAWVKGLNAQVDELSLEQAKDAWEAYFNGTFPLSAQAPKNREDIPDSFICRSIEDIIKNNINSKLVLIANDKKVIKDFVENKLINIYPNIEKFISEDHIKKILTDTDKLTKNKISEISESKPISNPDSTYYVERPSFDFFIEKLEGDNEIVKNYIEYNLEDSLANETFKNMPLSNEHDKEAKVISCNNVRDISLDFKNPIHYGEDHFGFKFYAKADVFAEYFVDKTDFYSSYYSDYENLSHINVDDWNKHTLQAESEVILNVSGIVSVNLKISKTDSMYLDDLRSEEYEEGLMSFICDADINIESLNDLTIDTTFL